MIRMTITIQGDNESLAEKQLDLMLSNMQVLVPTWPRDFAVVERKVEQVPDRG